VILEFFERLKSRGSSPALFNGPTYTELLAKVDAWSEEFLKQGIGAGSVCAVYGDFSPGTCSLILALIRKRAIVVPFTRAIESEIAELSQIAEVQFFFHFGSEKGNSNSFEEWKIEKRETRVKNQLTLDFIALNHPGLIVFSSGSTGKPKGILHDCSRVMEKFLKTREPHRAPLFLMMDHFGGFNTFLSILGDGGMGICVSDRGPENVCRLIEAARATLLPTTPTFLNLLIASGAFNRFDLTSVKVITYGTEVMHEATLERIRKIFPNAKIKQTYGLSELGVLRSKSENDSSLWVRVGGDGFEVKVVESILWIRARSNMVGYLNAPSPFDSDGWMCTGDFVECKDDYFRIIGRKSEMINVGGQKVFPAEVESVLLQAGNIREATVFGERHPLMGQVVMARLALNQPENFDLLKERLRKHCLERLAKFKIPMKFTLAQDGEDHHNERFKKVRKNADSPG
jgi:acyl-CoA synthetase (AMP-forming)/AMP-acid ligase II